MRIAIIVNPVAGRGRALRAAASLAQALRMRGETAELLPTAQPGDAERFARETAADWYVSAGGDGTANEVVNGLRDTGVPLALLPCGSANVVAGQFRLPRAPEAVAGMICDGHTVAMDLGTHAGRRFLLGAGAGLDAAIVAVVQGKRGRKSSVWRWVLPSIQTILRYPFPALRVVVDGDVLSEAAQYAIVGNCVYSAAVFPATPRARTNDGLLDVCCLENLYPLKMAWLAMAVWNPRYIEGRGVRYRQGREIRFERLAADPIPLQVDGDPAGAIPAEFGVLPGQLRLTVPR